MQCWGSVCTLTHFNRNSNISYGELRSIPQIPPKRLVQGYVKLPRTDIVNIVNTLVGYVSSNASAINLDPHDKYASQKWIAIKKKQIANLVATIACAYNAFVIYIRIKT